MQSASLARGSICLPTAARSLLLNLLPHISEGAFRHRHAAMQSASLARGSICLHTAAGSLLRNVLPHISEGPFRHRRAAMQSASLARGSICLHTAAATCPSIAHGRPGNLRCGSPLRLVCPRVVVAASARNGGGVRSLNHTSAGPANKKESHSEFGEQWHNGGHACVLGVGTANPDNCIQQDDYTDWYFRITKSDHLTQTKAVMKKKCEKMQVKKRYLQINEELFREHPEFLDPEAPTLSGKLAVVANAMPGLVAAAAEKAMAEWGRPAGEITHLVFATSTSAQMPHIDLRIASLLGLSTTVQRTVICFHGCSGSASALRIAKDIAENNRGARVLVACADLFSVMDGYVVPDVAQRYGITGRALFGDGAGAVVVGADPRQAPVERPIFEMVSVSQAAVPGSDHGLSAELTKCGLEYRLEFRDLAAQVGGNIERCLVDAVSKLGIGSVGWNDFFWVVHPGGPRIIESFTVALVLEPGKLAASRRVLSEYGNMMGPTLIFVLDEVIRRRQQDQEEGSCDCEWGFMVGFGPGFTIEVMALHSCVH